MRRKQGSGREYIQSGHDGDTLQVNTHEDSLWLFQHSPPPPYPGSKTQVYVRTQYEQMRQKVILLRYGTRNH